MQKSALFVMMQQVGIAVVALWLPVYQILQGANPPSAAGDAAVGFSKLAEHGGESVTCPQGLSHLES